MIRTISSCLKKKDVCEHCIHFIYENATTTTTKNNVVKTMGRCNKLSLFVDKNESPKCEGIYFKHQFDVYPF